MSWKSTSKTKSCHFASSPNILEYTWAGRSRSPTPRVTSQKADMTRSTLEAACWLGLGCWGNNVANSHLSPDPFNSRILRSCLVPHCSHLPHWPHHQRRLENCDWMLASFTPADNLPFVAGIQSDEPRRNGATPSQAPRVMEPGHLLHSALTCPPGGNVRHLKSRQPLVPFAQQLISSSDICPWQQYNGALGGSPMECGVVGEHYETPNFHHPISAPTLLECPGQEQRGSGFNCLRNSVRRFRSCFNKWGMAPSSACECDA